MCVRKVFILYKTYTEKTSLIAIFFSLLLLRKITKQIIYWYLNYITTPVDVCINIVNVYIDDQVYKNGNTTLLMCSILGVIRGGYKRRTTHTSFAQV